MLDLRLYLWIFGETVSSGQWRITMRAARSGSKAFQTESMTWSWPLEWIRSQLISTSEQPGLLQTQRARRMILGGLGGEVDANKDEPPQDEQSGADYVGQEQTDALKNVPCLAPGSGTCTRLNDWPGGSWLDGTVPHTGSRLDSVCLSHQIQRWTCCRCINDRRVLSLGLIE